MRSRNVITQFYTTEGRNDNYQLTTNYHFLLPATKKKEYEEEDEEEEEEEELTLYHVL